MWPFIRLTGFSQRVLSGECHWTIISKSPATPFLSGGNCPNARNITPVVNSHPPCVRGFMRMRESTRLTSSLYSTPSHAMLWAGITVLQKCSSEIHLHTWPRKNQGQGRHICCHSLQSRKQHQALKRLWKARLQHICKDGRVPKAPQLYHVGCGATIWHNHISKSTTGCDMEESEKNYTT